MTELGESSKMETSTSDKRQKEGNENILLELEKLRKENERLRSELEERQSLERTTSTPISDSPPHSSQNAAQFRLGLSEIKTIIEEFDPASNISAGKWIEGIEGLQHIYEWDDRLTLFYATMRLGGAATWWYQSKKNVLKRFVDFKASLIASFPSVRDASSILMEIMERKRQPGEPIEEYVYQVAALGSKIELPERSTINYIISGLEDQNLKNVLLSSNCSTIPELLVRIKSFEEIQMQTQKRRNIRGERQESGVFRQKNRARFTPYDRNKEIYRHKGRDGKDKGTVEGKEGGTSRSVRCFKCNEIGHYARSCGKGAEKCFACNLTGHKARQCPSKHRANVNRIEKENLSLPDEYHKWVYVSGVRILAFLDLGSECTTVKHSVATRNNWAMEECNTSLFGFGQKEIFTIGKIVKVVKVADLEKLIEIMVVSDDVQNRNFLDQPDVEIRKRNGKLALRMISDRGDKGIQELPPILAEDLKVGGTVENEEKKQLVELMNEYRDCIGKELEEVGKTDLVEMHIRLKEDKVIRYQPYKVAYGLKSQLREQVDRLLKLDIIQYSDSEYASPVVLVPKKNGEWRMCVDYRKLNSITQRENFPMPNIEETLNLLADQRVFTTLDLMSGYHQVPIHPDSRHYTAFVTPDGHYEFKRVPFGLTNSPAVFMKLMAKVIQPIQTGKVIVYMDDILIPTKTVRENLDVLRQLLNEMRKAGLTINIRKCSFLQTEITFLGHEVSSEGIKPGFNKIKAVSEYKRPENVKQVRQFLGLSGYFRRFVQGFTFIARPLNRLLRKDSEFKWGEEEEAAFNRLKNMLRQRPILVLYNPNAKHEVHTDASSFGIAGILMQEKNGTLRPVSYFSRATTEAESRYHSYELEALAVVESLERFKHYLLNKKFKIITDCNSLRLTQEKKNLVPRIARWWLRISEFDFDMEYRPAHKLAHVDALSRAPVGEEKGIEDVSSKMLIVEVATEDWLSTLQHQDPRINEIGKVLNGSIQNPPDQHGIKGNYVLEQGRIFKKTADGLRFVIPTGVRWRIIKSAHDDRGHPGLERTIETLRKHVWFPSMKLVTKKYINSCIDCLYNKRGADESRFKIHTPEKVPIPFHTVHIDHLGPFPKSRWGNLYIIGIVDAFSKFILLKAVRTTTTKGVIKMLEEVTQYFGMPTRIVSDRGTAFTSIEFRKYCCENMIQHVLTAVKTLRANGQVERYFRTVKSAVTTMTKEAEGRDWDKTVKSIQWALNNFKSSTTGVTPYKLVMTYEPKDILKNKLTLALHGLIEKEEEENMMLNELKEKVIRRMEEKQNKQAERVNKAKEDPRKYRVGELVLVKQEPPSTGQIRKLQPRFRGPYVVEAVLGHDRYVIKDAEQMQVTRKPYKSVHSAERLKPWCQLDDMDLDEDVSEDLEDELEKDDVNMVE